MFVTISVDDGHPADLRTADLLTKYGLKATFYVPVNNPERARLSETSLHDLSRSFELGGHGLNHVSLCSLSRQQAWNEVSGCKKWLEDLSGDRVISFCYPKGKVNRVVRQLVRQAGFLGARTCQFNLSDYPADPFAWGVTTHAYQHSHTIQMRHAFLEGNFVGAWNYWRVFHGTRDWVRQFLCALRHVEAHGGIAHLYMHSWEIDELGQWHDLESLFRAIVSFRSLVRASNGELFKLWRGEMRKRVSSLGEVHA